MSTVTYVAVGVGLAAWLLGRRRQKLPYPPGPPGLPVIGNVLDMPPEGNLTQWTEWGKQFNSQLIHLLMLNTHLVVINSAEAIREILEVNANSFSDRPPSTMLEICGGDWTFALWNNNALYRAQRKLFNQLLGSSSESNTAPSSVGYDVSDHALEAAHGLLRQLLDTPDEFFEHARFVISSAIMSHAYGIKPRNENDPYVQLHERGARSFLEATRPGAFMVDAFPFLRHVPAWFPGAGWKRLAMRWKAETEEMINAPLDVALDAAAKGTLPDCAVSSFLNDVAHAEDGKISHEDRATIRGIVASMYGAAIETSSSTMQTFFLAMILHPDVQHTAQTEIDALLRQARLPNLGDQPSLPYVSAIVKELLRWEPSLPLGLPHMSSKDFTYNGQFIPAGSVVFGNVWAVLYDSSVYPSPSTFDPARFLGPNPQPDPNATFGFGKRICPGRYLALDELFIAVASVLACYDISARDGCEVQRRYEATGISRRPAKFRCEVKPRSNECVQLIRATAE